MNVLKMIILSSTVSIFSYALPIPPELSSRPHVYSDIIKCQQEPVNPDDGFELYLAPVDCGGVDCGVGTYGLRIERSLLLGPVTELYTVIDKTKEQPIGAPALFEGNGIRLSIQGTTTPRPDNKKQGHFERFEGARQVEDRDLLCE
jgi:hypothetical protein